jgi:hypothetical protein
MDYEQKYKKYKIKYLELKRQLEGNHSLKISIPTIQLPKILSRSPTGSPSKSPSESPSNQRDDSSVLSVEDLANPNLLIVSNILFEINDLIESVPKEYNIRTFLEKEMLAYFKNNKLVRPPSYLLKIAKLKCTQDKIRDTFSRLLTQKQVTENDGDLDGLVLLQSKAHSVAIGIASLLLEGIDLNLFENYIWDREIPNGLSIYEKQMYILDNGLKIIGVPDRDKDRTSEECLHIQESIAAAREEYIAEKLANLDKLLASKEDKDSLNYCQKVVNLTAGVPRSFFKEGTKYYNLIGYNPNDMNVSRDNPDPEAQSFAYAGLLKNPNNLFKRSMGMNYIKNVNTGKPINSNCFNQLRYYQKDYPLSKTVDERGKYVSNPKL